MDVLARILQLRERRGWTEYQLAEQSGITQSTISAWYNNNRIPTIASLEKICAAFEMSLSLFFSEGEDLVALSPQQREMLEHWGALDTAQRDAVLALVQVMPRRPE